MTKEREIEMQIEGLAMDVLQLLVTERGLSLEDAMDTLYNSKTFQAVERPETGLYYESPLYVYDCLLDELAHRR